MHIARPSSALRERDETKSIRADRVAPRASSAHFPRICTRERVLQWPRAVTGCVRRRCEATVATGSGGSRGGRRPLRPPGQTPGISQTPCHSDRATPEKGATRADGRARREFSEGARKKPVSVPPQTDRAGALETRAVGACALQSSGAVGSGA